MRFIDISITKETTIMKTSPRVIAYKGVLSLISSIASIILTTQSGFAAPGDKVHAFFADEHNTTPTGTTGNRILEIDIDNMTLVNTLDVPGNAGHHADNGFNSKIYGVPKGSNFVNVVELRKDTNGTTSMNLTKKIDLIHTPRSGDAYNKKFNVILMVARNRPMGSFINVETDEIVGTIGENIDCTLTDGTQLLSHADANTSAGALKYHCARPATSHGGDQISGHPYWLTADYAAIVDRANKQISVYHVQQVGSNLVSTLVNHLPTRSSIHQIIPRDRTNLPAAQQADFYATEEGEHVGNAVNGRGATDADYAIGVSHALIHMKLTTNGLELVKRMDLQRTAPLSKVKSDRILDACISIYRNTFGQSITLAGPNPDRESRYAALFQTEGITRSLAQDANNDFPVDCFFPGIPGGHNADFAANNRHNYVGMAGGATSIIDVNRWKIANNVDIGIRSGPGHTCFSENNNIAITTNHGVSFARTIMDINSERPHSRYWLNLPFTRAGLINTYQSHTCYVDEEEEFYYNFFTDGGVYYKMNLAEVAANTQNGATLITDSLVTGGIPIQGSYLYVKNIKDLIPPPAPFVANNDTATSNGSAVTIDVMSNDTGDSLTLEHADGASNGQVEIVNGQAVYTPTQGFSGTDGFWYGISSPGLAWEWAYVKVTVTSTTTPVLLVANDDAVSTTSGDSVTINVLDNDQGTNMSLAIIDTAWTGTLSRSGNSIVYQSEANFVGEVDFWYAVTDAVGNEEWANVVVTVNTPNSLVTAYDDAVSVAKGGTVSINVLDNDSGNNLVLSVVDSAWTGTASQSGNAVVYQAPTDFIGDVVIWYEAMDANGNEDWAKVIVTITDPAGTSVIANDDTATVKKGNSVSINVLANDSGNNIFLSVVDLPWIGTASKSGNNIFYQAATDFTGDVTIWYEAMDPDGNESWAKVIVTITN